MESLSGYSVSDENEHNEEVTKEEMVGYLNEDSVTIDNLSHEYPFYSKYLDIPPSPEGNPDPNLAFTINSAFRNTKSTSFNSLVL